MRTIVRVFALAGLVALEVALGGSPLRATTLATLSVEGTTLSGSITTQACPSGSGTCFVEAFSGPVSKNVSGLVSAVTLDVQIFRDQTTAVVAPERGSCYPVQGTGQIQNPNQTRLFFQLQGWTCDSPAVFVFGHPTPAPCVIGPLNFYFENFPGDNQTRFGPVTGATGTFNAQSPSCFSIPGDVSVIMSGVLQISGPGAFN